MSKPQFYWHLYVQQKLSDGKKKHFYFRYDVNDTVFECEQYISDGTNFTAPQYGAVDKEFYEEIVYHEDSVGSSPTIYFGNKGDDWTAFGENLLEQIRDN